MTGVRTSSTGKALYTLHEQYIACIAFSAELRSANRISIT